MHRPLPTPSFEIIAVDTGNIPHINNNGDVVFNYRHADGTRHLALYHGDTEFIEDLNIVGTNYGINDHGQILGVVQDANLQFSEYFVYTPELDTYRFPLKDGLGSAASTTPPVLLVREMREEEITKPFDMTLGLDSLR